jgi:hypothetical protein
MKMKMKMKIKMKEFSATYTAAPGEPELPVYDAAGAMDAGCLQRTVDQATAAEVLPDALQWAASNGPSLLGERMS